MLFLVRVIFSAVVAVAVSVIVGTVVAVAYVVLVVDESECFFYGECFFIDVLAMGHVGYRSSFPFFCLQRCFFPGSAVSGGKWVGRLLAGHEPGFRSERGRT